MEDRQLKRLNNHLMAAEENTAPKCRVYNTDATDVDLEDYAGQVDTPVRRPHRGFWIFLLAVAVIVAVYFLSGGKLLWN